MRTKIVSLRFNSYRGFDSVVFKYGSTKSSLFLEQDFELAWNKGSVKVVT